MPGLSDYQRDLAAAVRQRQAAAAEASSTNSKVTA